MKVKVYQIDENLDKNNLLFERYEFMEKEIGKIDSSIYKTVYDGNIEASNLEEIYSICNTNHPVGYNGHSLSVSDVVELEDGSCYYCDSFGFKKVDDFDISATKPIVGYKMLVIEPHKVPYAMIIPDGLAPLQQAVKGYIEASFPFDDNAYIICNEEGKLIGLEANRVFGNDVYVGNILIVADDGEGGTTDLTDEQIAKYTEIFKNLEIDTDIKNDICFFEIMDDD